MHEIVTVRVVDLLLDQRNARLGTEQDSQPATCLALAKLSTKYLMTLAEDVVDNGMDPLSLPAVVATGDRRRRYTVLEGNRRVLAVKALDTPSLVLSALDTKEQRKLNALSNRFHADPIDEIECVLFDDEAAARHWIFLRHTGLNDGAGIVGWDPDQQDAYKARHHGGKRNTSGQVIDLLNRMGADIPTRGISSNITRLLSSPEVRKAMGLRLVNNELQSEFPAAEVAKGLEYMTEELSARRLKVGDIYEADQRRDWAKKLPRSARPTKSTRLPEPVPLEDLPVEDATKKKAPAKKAAAKSRPRAAQDETSVVPRDCNLSPTNPRLNEIFNELATLAVDSYPNACSVLLRVFAELSVDLYIERKNLYKTEQDHRNAKLAGKLKLTATHLKDNGKIPAALCRAIHNVADGNGQLLPSITGMHAYVHNPYAFPKPSEQRRTWRELQPFFEALEKS